MRDILEAFQTYILPLVTLVLSFYGWRATSEKNKLKAELKGLEASNVALEIENQKSWLDLYKQLHDDQASRMVSMEREIQSLKKTVEYFEYVFKKIQTCLYVDVCPIGNELQNRKRDTTKSKPRGHRQPRDKGDDEGNTDNATGIESATNDPDREPP